MVSHDAHSDFSLANPEMALSLKQLGRKAGSPTPHVGDFKPSCAGSNRCGRTGDALHGSSDPLHMTGTSRLDRNSQNHTKSPSRAHLMRMIIQAMAEAVRGVS